MPDLPWVQLSSYDPLAREYYQPRHITSRNFDAASQAYLQGQPISLPDRGFALDLGAGRGRLAEYCRVPPRRIIQADLSFSMLTLTDRERAFGRVVSNALELPFNPNSFTIVAAFLFDPFNNADFFTQVTRIMSPSAVFVGTLPHYEWGRTLRVAHGAPLEEAVFVLENGKRLTQPSLLSPPKQLAERLQCAGLTMTNHLTLTLPPTITHVSPDIQLPARLLNTSVYNLPLVQLLVATKI